MSLLLALQSTSTVLVIQDATHSHAADGLVLVQHNVLVVQDALHAHTADNLVLLQHSVLAIQDALHGHLAENLGLTQHNLLTIQDALHGHLADNVVLITSGVSISKKGFIPWAGRRSLLWKDKEEREEMKLSQILAQQLEETVNENRTLAQINHNLLDANNKLLDVVTEIKDKAVVVPTMDPDKKAELLRRLELARAAKEAKKQAEEAKKKEFVKRMMKGKKNAAKKK